MALCDDCAAAVINGILCHEHGCPARRRELEEARRCELEDIYSDELTPDKDEEEVE